MKQILQKLISLSSWMRFASIVGFAAAIVVGCQRTVEMMAPASGEFNADAAKEWYYGVFKKSPEWSSSVQHGKKIPDWQHGTYRKIGQMELIEFPLKKAFTNLSLLGYSNLSKADKKKIGAASLSRIVFIKQFGTVSVREVNYIPGWTYLNQKAFDISTVGIGKPENDFSGTLVVKKLDGTDVAWWKVEKGKRGKRINLKQGARPKKELVRATARTTDICQEEICHYIQWCYVLSHGDIVDGIQCDEEQLDYCEIVEVDCGDDDPGEGGADCAGLSQEECYCQTFGVGCGGEGGGEEQTCKPENVNAGNEVADNYLSGITISDQTTAISTVTSSDGNHRTRHYSWIFLRAINGTWTSNDKSEQVKGTDGVWHMESLSHVDESRNTTDVGIDVQVTVKNVAPTVGQFSALMHFDAEVKSSLFFSGCPISRTQVFKPYKAWDINDGN